MGRILAVQESVQPSTGMISGTYRAILTVQNVVGLSSTVRLYGQQAFASDYANDPIITFSRFLSPFIDQPATWAEMGEDENILIADDFRFLSSFNPRVRNSPFVPVHTQLTTIQGYGFQPAFGFYVTFPLSVGIFQPGWDKINTDYC